MCLCCVVLLAIVLPNVSGYLQVSGTTLTHKGQRVFLSGANIAWNCYGCDFGNGQYSNNGPQLEAWLKQIGENGGNTVRKYYFSSLDLAEEQQQLVAVYEI